MPSPVPPSHEPTPPSSRARLHRIEHRADDARPREVVVPVVAEQVTVHKVTEPVERVRAETRVVERQVDLDAEVMHESIEVQRIPVSRFVDHVPQVRVEGDVTIVPVVEEVAFVTKRLLLKEEVHLVKRRVIEQRTAQVPVREEHVHIERLPVEDAGTRRKS